MAFTNPMAIRSWGRPKSCRTALLAILCWEALRGMRQQLSLNVWILANTGLCVWDSFTVGLFGCYQCNIKWNRKRLSMEKTQTRLQLTQCVQSPTRTGNTGGFPVLQLALIVGMEGSRSFLKATFLPQHLWAHLLLVKHASESVLSTSQILSLPVASLLSLDLNCLTYKLPILSFTPSLFPTLISAPGSGSLLAQRGTVWSYPSQGASPASSPSLAPTLLLCF